MGRFKKFNPISTLSLKGKKIIALLLAVMLLVASLGIQAIFTASASEDYIETVITNSFESYEIGKQPANFKIVDNKSGQRPENSKATAIVKAGSGGVGQDKTIVVDSPVAEGQGPVCANPEIQYTTDIELKGNVNTFITYLKTPQIGFTTDAKYPPNNWSVALFVLNVEQAATGFNQKALYYNGAFNNFKVQGLAKGETEWKTYKFDESSHLLLPSGFEGYIKIDIKNCGIYNDWLDKGFDPTKDAKVTNLTIDFGWLGGEYGSFEIGGFYTVLTDSNSANIKVVDSIQTNLSVDLSNIPDNSNISSDIVSISGGSQTVAKLGSAATYNFDHKSIVISSAVVESPVVTLKSNANVASSQNVYMIYVKTPAVKTGEEWALAISELSYAQGGKVFSSKFNNATYSYLANDAAGWSTAKTDADGKLKFSKTFTGYIRLYLNTAETWTDVENFDKNKDYTLSSIKFTTNHLGGEYGDFIIGGSYSVKRDFDSLLLSVNDSESKAMLDPDINVFELKSAFKTSGITAGAQIASTDISITNNRTTTTLHTKTTYGENISRLTSNKAYVFSSTTAEGMGISNTAYPVATIKNLSVNINAGVDKMIMYMKSPAYQTGSSAGYYPIPFRLYQITAKQDGVSGNLVAIAGKIKISYMSKDSDTWKEFTTGNNGDMYLPQDFEGYVKVDFSQLKNKWSTSNAQFNPNKNFKVTAITIQIGHIGGKYGDLKFGDFFEVVKDSASTRAKLDGAAAVDMVVIENPNDALIRKFTNEVNSIGEIDIADADVLEKATQFLESIEEEFVAKIDADVMAKYNEAVKKFALYAPTIIGTKIKTPEFLNSDYSNQALKLGVKFDETAALAAGYEVDSFGTVFIYGDNLAGTNLTTSTQGAVSKVGLKTETEGNVTEFTSTFDVTSLANFNKTVVARAYVVYKNSQTNEKVTVWNSNYVYSDGHSEILFQCSVMDVALSNGISFLS